MNPAKWDEPCKISVGIFSFAVWWSDWGTRRRGWCRAEMWCKLLSERSKVPIVATRRLMQWENPRNTGYPQIIHFRLGFSMKLTLQPGKAPHFGIPRPGRIWSGHASCLSVEHCDFYCIAIPYIYRIDGYTI